MRGPSPKHLWNHLYQRHQVVRWIDDWWYDRGRIPATIMVVVGEVLINLVGFGLTSLARPIVIGAGRLFAYSNEIHTGYRAIRHRDKSWFNQSQTWNRLPDGSFMRTPGLDEADDAGTPTPRMGSLARRFLRRMRVHASDLWTERTHLPGFIVGLCAAVLGVGLGVVAHAPPLVMWSVSQGLGALQVIPEVRNGILSVVHRTTAYYNKPQLLRSGRVVRDRLVPTQQPYVPPPAPLHPLAPGARAAQHRARLAGVARSLDVAPAVLPRRGGVEMEL